MEALEYDADLRSWWEKGYGYKLTALLSQMLLTEVAANTCLMRCTWPPHLPHALKLSQSIVLYLLCE